MLNYSWHLGVSIKYQSKQQVCCDDYCCSEIMCYGDSLDIRGAAM